MTENNKKRKGNVRTDIKEIITGIYRTIITVNDIIGGKLIQ